MDTEVKAVGNTPEIGENGNWFIDGEDTGYPAVARDGVTPTVGENGNGGWVTWTPGFPPRARTAKREKTARTARLLPESTARRSMRRAT